MNCSNNDEGEEPMNPLVGVYVGTMSCTYDVGSLQSSATVTITQSTSGILEEVAIKGLFGDARVHNAITSGSFFSLQGNSNGINGSGTLANDGRTIEWTVNDPNNLMRPNLSCTGVVTKEGD